MRWIGAGVVLGLVLLRVDCDKPPSCRKLSKMTPTVELGTGSAFFRRLEDGDDMEVTQGPQGGMHVWVSARFTGVMPGDASSPFDPVNPLLEIVVLDESGEEIASSTRIGALKVREDESAERVGEIVQFTTNRIDDVAWKDATIELYFLDSCDTELTDSREVRLVTGCSEEQTD